MHTSKQRNQLRKWWEWSFVQS